MMFGLEWRQRMLKLDYGTRTLIEAIGEDAALSLIEKHGGTRVYIPIVAEDSKLAADIGVEAAAKLATVHQREWFLVPLGRVWRVQRLYAADNTIPAIARAVGMTESGVRRMLRKIGLLRGAVVPDRGKPNRPKRRSIGRTTSTLIQTKALT